MKGLGDNTDHAAQRHLTSEEKARELKYLEGRIADGPDPDGNGGQGYIDFSIVPYLRRINSLDGVCTMQSCAGHVLASTIDGKEYIHPGNLWLRLSEDMARRFYHHVSDLVRSPLIGRVSTLYLWHDEYREVREVIDISFRGEERGIKCFVDSMEEIVCFLRELIGTGALYDRKR